MKVSHFISRYFVISFLVIFFLTGRNARAQFSPVYDSPAARHWADSVFNQLSYKQKIGQLFMVEAFSNKDQAHVNQVKALIDSCQVGGLIFFQGGPVREVLLTNYYQSITKIPLMIGMDAEWGVNMRLDSTIRFPRQMTMSAGTDPQLVYAMGKEVGRQCKRVGIQIDFAPSVDVNNNPANPVINSRSFGEDKTQVAELGNLFMKGMQSMGVLACAKHFPGHGNTDSDSHLSLPSVLSDRAELDTMELVPFKKLIKDSVASVMVAHLYVPSLDSTANLASTLSPAIVNDLLQKQLGFRGLIFTDALTMKGVTKYFSPGELEVKALQSGNDVLLCSEDAYKAIDRIHIAIQNCEIEQSEIDKKVQKILMAKYWAGLDHFTPLDTTDLVKDLNNPAAQNLNYKLYENSVTLLRNKNNLVPLNTCYRNNIASIVVNDTLNNYFQLILNRYSKVDCFSMNKDASKSSVDSLLNKVNDYDRIIVSIHNTSTNASKNFNVTESIKYITAKLAKKKNVVLVIFGNAYVLGKVEELEHQECVILSYEDTYLPQQFTAEKLFGAGAFEGKLPVTPVPDYTRGMGLSPAANNLLKYNMPEELGIPSSAFSRIDTIVQKAINDTVFPGCQILVAVKGNVIYSKSFGYHTYDKISPVKNSDLYDIASVSKMAATGIAAMMLVDKHRIDPDQKASRYLPELRKSNKSELTIRQLLAHEAGLQAWIPFWKNTVDTNGLRSDLYRKTSEPGFSIHVADSIYLLDSYKDSLWNQIIKSSVDSPGKYVYSDLGLLIMQKIVEKVSGKALNEFVEEYVYRPLGLWQTLYNPREKFDASVIVPTEIDTVFRKQLVNGFVHDPAAAMLGGVAGNAGVFTNAQSLAVIMQMLLNDGEYAGERFISSQTVESFTRPAFPESSNRRGMVFDKPEPGAGKNGPTAASASPLTFGHTGFTGTCAWADPEKGLIYIFLSNRVYPSAANNKLAKTNVRTDIMQVIYDALEKKK